MASKEVKAIVSTVASVAAAAMIVRSMANDFIPKEFRSYVFDSFHDVFHRFSSKFTVLIHEFQGPSPNLVFEAVEVYLGTIVNTSTKSIRLGKTENDKSLVITMDKDEEIIDDFEDFKVKWKMECRRIESGSSQNDEIKDMISALCSELRCYELSFHKKYKERVLKSYLPYIMERSKYAKEESRAIKLYSNFRNWGSDGMNLEHPMTFDTLAMDKEIKTALIQDLECFVKGKDYYNRIGKAWKRGYLLYGPPGTGKSSLIASMANHLNYDIYDLDLTEVRSNSNLRSLLLGMSGRSILVIEDIDCSINLENRGKNDEKENKHNRVTLSGILNFLDGIWSCCGEERIIVVTTNHIDKLDAALLRPGRMDMHIHMSYCKLSAFKQLVFNYLGIREHEMIEQIGEMLEEVDVTPADVAGELLKSKNPNISLRGLMEFLENKITEQEMLRVRNGLAEETRTVYCDTCRVQFETKLSELIEGATVKLQCRNIATGVESFSVEGVTDKDGKYRLTVQGDHQEDICEVTVVKSPREDCKESVSGYEKARIECTDNTGIHNDVRYANSLFFMKAEPVQGCKEVLDELGLYRLEI